MTYRYFISVFCSLVLITTVLGVYFYLHMPKNEAKSSYKHTQYQGITLNGPIQPIPNIASIDKDWVQLGKALFNSKLLSRDNSISCASCHSLGLGGDDGFPVSVGFRGQLGTRNSPTVLNAVFNFRQFWDGRSADLADQVVGPIHNPVEMSSNWPEIISKLSQIPEFVSAFRSVGEASITSEAIIRAIVTFEESLITPNSPIDRYLLGEVNALTEQQKRGFDKFIGFGCVSCHQGRNIGGNLYQRIGRVDKVPAILLEDKGRYGVTQNSFDKHVFKVPTLRNVAETAPYFHNGAVSTLEEAVEIMAIGQLGLALSENDVKDIVALLHAFTGELSEHAL